VEDQEFVAVKRSKSFVGMEWTWAMSMEWTWEHTYINACTRTLVRMHIHKRMLYSLATLLTLVARNRQ
jgi:hypothetical protein